MADRGDKHRTKNNGDDDDDDDDEEEEGRPPWTDVRGAFAACLVDRRVRDIIVSTLSDEPALEVGDMGAWVMRAAAALWPPPDEARSLLPASMVPRGKDLSATYEVLAHGVPAPVLSAVAWRGQSMSVGFCIHPLGCGPVATRPDGRPSRVCADRVFRMRFSAPEGRDLFRVEDVLKAVASFYAQPLAGGRLEAVCARVHRWYAQSALWWPPDAIESIECFVERCLLDRKRTGCTAAELVAGRLQPCQWLVGAHARRSGAVGASGRALPSHGAPGTGTPRLRRMRSAARHPKGKERIRNDDDERVLYVEDSGDDDTDTDLDDEGNPRRPSHDDAGGEEDHGDPYTAKRPGERSSRAIYDRIICRWLSDKEIGGTRRPVIYVQTRACAAADRD
jgi:hypothetical protein